MLKKIYPPWDAYVYVKAGDLNKMYFEKICILTGLLRLM